MYSLLLGFNHITRFSQERISRCDEIRAFKYSTGFAYSPVLLLSMMLRKCLGLMLLPGEQGDTWSILDPIHRVSRVIHSKTYDGISIVSLTKTQC